MKKLLTILAVVLFMFSSIAYAGGDKNWGDEGQGVIGEEGGGSTTQNSQDNPYEPPDEWTPPYAPPAEPPSIN